MWLLALDTTTREASVALFRDAAQAALAAPAGDTQQSVGLFLEVEKLLAGAGLKLGDLDAYAVANGPGAFTALRVGLAAVKGFAEVSRKPVVGVSALEAVCESAGLDGVLAPLVNAYRGQVFGAVYDCRGGERRLRGPERVLTPAEFLAALAEEGVEPRSCTLVGPHLENFAAEISASAFRATPQKTVPAALAPAVARCALARLARGQATDALHLEANYVRRSDAELLWKGK